MFCNNIKKKGPVIISTCKKIPMDKDGEPYIISGTEYQGYICPVCGNMKKKIINSFLLK